jgi:uncharacterized protein YjiS (DUF1127 family)
LHREQCFYCTEECTASHLLPQSIFRFFEGTTMSKTWDSHTLTTLGSERRPLATLSRLARFPALWRKRLRCRRELSTLTAAQMRDTGLDPELVRRESRKPFWKA